MWTTGLKVPMELRARPQGQQRDSEWPAHLSSLSHALLPSQSWSLGSQARLIFLFQPHCSIQKFLGQGSNPSCHRNLHHSCGRVGSLTHCARLGIEHVPQQ